MAKNMAVITKRLPLRTVRVAQGLSLREVSRLTGIDVSQLSKVERGLAGLSMRKLRKVAEVLGLDSLASILEPYLEPSPNGHGHGNGKVKVKRRVKEPAQ